jgi:rRNA small subunit aminocarboxypropyltransferase
MNLYPQTIILRHRRENLKKCSLTGLENREDFLFFTYPKAHLPDLSHYVLLTLDAPVLTEKDKEYGLFLIDGTWKHAKTMFHSLTQPHRFICRSLPGHFRTAYPRRQTECPDRDRGLSSLEALYLAYRILGREAEDLLKNYYWQEQFLAINFAK